MTIKKPSAGSSTRLPAYAMMMGAMSAGAGAAVTFGQGLQTKPLGMRGATMTPQEQDFIMAKVDARMADLRTDVRLNTQGLADLKDRFTDLAGKMASVPKDVATLTERVSHLPTKEYMVKVALGSLAVIAALVTFGEKLQALVH